MTYARASTLHSRQGLHREESRWFAVKTPYKREKIVVKRIHQQGLEAYVPLLTRVKKYQRKIKTYEVPLIHNYAFVKIRAKDYVSVLQTMDVVDFIKFDGQLVAIPETEMDLLKRIVGEVSEVEVQAIRPASGQRVEVIGGKLTGLRGLVIEEKSKHLFLIELETIGWSIRLEVNEKYLRPMMP